MTFVVLINHKAGATAKVVLVLLAGLEAAMLVDIGIIPVLEAAAAAVAIVVVGVLGGTEAVAMIIPIGLKIGACLHSSRHGTLAR